MKNNNKYCNKNKSALIAYCNNILSKLMHGFATGYNSAFGCVKRFTLKFCCIKIKSLLPTLNHHGHTLIPSWRCSYIACATDKTKFWLSLSCFGFCTRIWVCAMIGLVVTNAIVNLCIKMKGNSKCTSGNLLSLLGDQNKHFGTASQMLLTKVKLRLQHRLFLHSCHPLTG